MSIETESDSVISILKNIKQEKFEYELDATFLTTTYSQHQAVTNKSSNYKMEKKSSTRKPRSNTVEVKLTKPIAARSKSPRPKSRSQSRSRKSLPTAAKPPSPTRKASPARATRAAATKKAPAASANLGAKLYTKVKHKNIFFHTCVSEIMLNYIM
jgi:hypothetical protein